MFTFSITIAAGLLCLAFLWRCAESRVLLRAHVPGRTVRRQGAAR